MKEKENLELRARLRQQSEGLLARDGRVRQLKRFGAIAATLLFAALLTWQLLPTTGSDLPAGTTLAEFIQQQPPPSISGTLSAASEQAIALEKITAAYKKGNYQSVVELAGPELAGREAGENAQLLLMYGYSLGKIDSVAAGVRVFKQIPNGDNYRQLADWYRGLFLLEEGDNSREVISIFCAIAGNDYHRKRKAAKELLKYFPEGC